MTAAGTVKCVVWDIDNTLLTGTYLESGDEPPGADPVLTAVLAELGGRGILHALASKNPPEAAAHTARVTGWRFAAAECGWGNKSDALTKIEGPMIYAEEAETSLAIALGQRVEMDRATRDAWDRGAAVKDAGFQWTSFGQYGMRHAGPKVVVPMDMLRDITESGVVGDATRASAETGEKIVAALIPRIVQVCKEMAGKD